MTKFFKEKKSKIKYMEDQHRIATGLQYTQEISISNRPKSSIFLLKGLLVFMEIYGTILFYASCFEITFNSLVVIPLLMGISIYSSFLYYNNITKNIGYILFILIFVFSFFHFRQYANSGFAAIYNITYDVIDEIYQLPAVRHLAESIPNRYDTITICLCYLGTAGVVLLNMSISRSVNLFGTLFLTLPFALIGMYFDRSPSSISVIMLSSCYITAILLKYTYTDTSNIRNQPYIFKSQYKKKNYYFPLDGKITGQACAFSVCIFTTIYILLNLFVPQHSLSIPEQWKSYKSKTDEAVRSFMIVGFSGLFNRYDAAGGISGGKLGGAASIRPDFETDLVVRFTPYSYDTVYLKAFNGVSYYSDHWESIEENRDDSEILSNFNNLTLNEIVCNSESHYFKNKYENGVSSAVRCKMQIDNIDADPNYPYLPYYTDVKNSTYRQNVSHSIVKGISPVGQTDELIFYPDTDGSDRFFYNGNFPDYKYYTVPEELEWELYDFCKEISLVKNGLRETDEQIINQVVDYFKENYPYSMNPGATPRNKDFVSFFLFENKKGFCVHFASAAALIFRTMGIPARYAEGYVIPYERVIDSDILENESYTDWLQGDSPIGKTAVVEVEVNDSMAHAWVEVWLPAYGWLPVEVTPSSYMNEENYRDFWSFFANLLNDGNNSGDDQNNPILPVINEEHMGVIQAVFSLLLILTATFFMLRYACHCVVRIRSFHTNDRNNNLTNRYRFLCNQFRTAYSDFEGLPNQSEQLKWLRNLADDEGYKQDLHLTEFYSTLSKASYSPYTISEEEYFSALKALTQMRKLLYKTLTMRKKIKLLIFSIR